MRSAGLLLAALATHGSIVSAQSYQLYDLGGYTCNLQVNDNFCGCSGHLQLDGVYTCEQIINMVTAGTNGGHVGPLPFCDGTIEVNFFAGGSGVIDYLSSNNECSDGCDFAAGQGSCSV